jgi:hypothetical protein
VIIHQKPAILMKQAIVLVNVEFGGYNGTTLTTATSITHTQGDTPGWISLSPPASFVTAYSIKEDN